MHWILSDVGKILGRGEVVAKTADGIGSSWASTANISPDAEKVDQKVTTELDCEHLEEEEEPELEQFWRWKNSHLWNNVKIGHKCWLEDDRNVGSVEQFDGVRTILATITSRLDGQINPESLEVDDYRKDKDRGQKIHQVWQVLAVKSFSEGSNLVLSSGQQVEETNDGSFELSSTTSVDSGWRESFPDDCFADVGGDEERDPRPETVSFLQQFIQQKDDETSDEQLDDDQETDTSPNVTWIPIHPCHHIHDRLTDCDHHSENWEEKRSQSEEMQTWITYAFERH